MKHNQSSFETGEILTSEQEALQSFLKQKNKLNFVDSNGLKDFKGAKNDIKLFAEQALQAENLKQEPDDETVRELTACLNEQDLNAVLRAEGLSEKPEEQRIKEFYEGERFKELYLLAKKNKEDKNEFGRVRVEDIGKLLKNGTTKDQEIFKLLDDPKNKPASYLCWTKADIKQRTEAADKEKELKNIDEFFEAIDQLKPEEQKDVNTLLEAFAKKHPQYAEQIKTKWYQDTFKAKLEANKDPELKKLNEFYSKDLKEIYKHVSNTLGKAPEWEDVAAEMEKRGFDNLLQIIGRNRSVNKKLWTETWQKAKEDFEKVENDELTKFMTEKDDPKQWANVDKLAQEFQERRKRFAGDERLKWYKDQLENTKKTKEGVWKMQLHDFYNSKLPQIYDQIQTSDKGYVRFKNVIAHLKSNGDERLAYLLEEKFKAESTTAWDKFWQAKEQAHNAIETQKFDAFFTNLDAAKLDDPEALKAEYEKSTGNKANSQWFNDKLKVKTETVQKELESKHLELANTLPDKGLAAAMQSAFKNAKTFADRKTWLAENQQKVAEYIPLIESNTQTENELAAKAADYPDLKKSLATIKGEYNEGKKDYAKGFYSPRKYADALQDLSAKLNERERLVETTLSRIENTTFNQIPKSSDPKEVDYDKFKERLKKQKIYKVDSVLSKNEGIKKAARKRTKELHQQWLDHRSLHLEQDTRARVEKSQAVIRRVKLPKNLPDGVKTYEDFTIALKEKGVYDALPKGVLKNKNVRASAHDQNLKMWAAYQTAQAKLDTKTDTPESQALTNDPKLNAAQNVIKGVTLNTNLKTKLDEKLTDKDAQNPDTFTVALREIGIYKNVDKSLWQTPALREMAWQQNMKLQAEYLSPSVDKTVVEADQQAENNAEHGLPGHYKLDWKGLDNRLAPDQKARGIERFKQMHNRSDIGLQTLMSQFHGPLGTFILETLAVMPKDRYEKAVNALRDVRIEAGKRDQASLWMKTLCQAAGTDYLQKEASASWSNFRQNFSTHFGTSIDKAWEDEGLAETTDVTETSDELEVKTSERANAILDEPKEDTAPPTDDKASADDNAGEEQDNQPLASEVLSDDIIEAETEDLVTSKNEEPVLEDKQEDADRNTEIEATTNEDVAESDTASINITEEPVSLETQDEEVDASVVEDESFNDLDEPTEDDTDTLEDSEVIMDDTETAVLLDEEGESEPDDSEITDDAIDADLDDTELLTDDIGTELESDELVDESAEVETDVDEDVEASDSPALETVEIEDDRTEDNEVLAEEIPEVINVIVRTPEQQTAATQKASQTWKAHQSTQQDDSTITQRLTPNWLKKAVSELPSDEELAALLKDPKLRGILKAQIKNQADSDQNQPHFTTTLAQEMYFSSSVTVPKFLEQIKTYALLSADIDITIGHHKPEAEITKEQAKALFEAFAEKLHATQNINTLTLSCDDTHLSAKVTVGKNTQQWQFGLK